MKIAMTLTGLDGLRRRVAKMPAVVDARTAAVVSQTATAFAQRARSLAPVRSGHLRASIVARATGLSGRITVEAPYARFVEFGTRYMPARPFFRAAREGEAAALEARVRAMGSALERDWEKG